MAYYDRDYYQEDPPGRPVQTPAMGLLTKVLIGVVCAGLIWSVILTDSVDAARALAHSLDGEPIRAIALSPWAFFPSESGAVYPWQVLTSVLIPSGIISAAMTAVIAIWLLGSWLDRALGRRRYGLFLLASVLVTGVASAAIDPLLAPLFGRTSGVFSIGSGPVAMAIMMAVGAMMPEARSFFHIRVRTVTFVLSGIWIMLSFAGYFRDEADRGLLAVVESLPGMLAGAGFGWFGMKWMMARGKVRVPGQKAREQPEDFLAYARKFDSKAVQAPTEETRRRVRETKRISKQIQRESEEQAAVDQLLERISASGINSLSRSEKAFLERVSRRKREKDRT